MGLSLTTVTLEPNTSLGHLHYFFRIDYRRFVSGYTKLAFPLHSLSWKKAQSVWSAECETYLEVLRQKLITSPFIMSIISSSGNE